MIFLQGEVIIVCIAKYFEDPKLYAGENELFFYVIKHPEKLMKNIKVRKYYKRFFWIGHEVEIFFQ